jgi:hypothetical protein
VVQKLVIHDILKYVVTIGGYGQELKPSVSVPVVYDPMGTYGYVSVGRKAFCAEVFPKQVAFMDC